MAMRRVMAVAAGMLAVVAGGCGLPKDPTVSVTAVREGESGPEQRVVLFTLRAENENSEPVPLLRAEYAVEVEGRTVFSGVRAPEVSVPGNGEQTFVLPAVVPAGSSGPYRIRGGVTYLWPGRIFELLLDEDSKRPTVGFEGVGGWGWGGGGLGGVGAGKRQAGFGNRGLKIGIRQPGFGIRRRAGKPAYSGLTQAGWEARPTGPPTVKAPCTRRRCCGGSMRPRAG